MRVMLGAVVASAVLVGAARAGEDTAPQRDWRAAAGSEGLPAEEIERIAATKLLVAGPEFRQVFEPYIDSHLPTFVTSDAVLNAYHVLFEESVVRLERVQATRLPGVLRTMWDAIPDALSRFDLPRDFASDVTDRARVTLGTALRLLHQPTPGASAEVSSLIDAEVARVVAATERVRPKWLGEPDDGFPFLDYAKFEPRGFYVRDETLKSYFRAVSWLQAIPLRLDQERELFTALLLAESTGRAHAIDYPPTPYRQFTSVCARALGCRGDAPLPSIAPSRAELWNPDNVLDFRAKCARAWNEANGVDRDEDRFATPTDPQHGVVPSVRILPATLTPDGIVMDVCCPPSREPAYPTGLYVAATLGGSLATREALRGRDAATAERLRVAFEDLHPRVVDGAVLEFDTDQELPPNVRRANLFGAYLGTIASLLDAPEPEAPALFGSPAWQAKSTNTVLAGWAQLRHTWTLQTHENADYGAAEDVVAGFVEPDPVFFERLADLASASAAFFAEQGAFDPSFARRELLWQFRDYAAHLRGPDGLLAQNELPDSKATLLRNAAWTVRYIGQLPLPEPGSRKTTQSVARELEVLDAAILALEGNGPLPPRLQVSVAGLDAHFSETWRYLERTCSRLASMAHKELRGQAWTAEESLYLREFGHVLARAMFYGGNAYCSPRDDAPRATSVYAWLGDPKAAGYFHAAISRPRALYVLYPWKDREVLCRGAVMPYREFVDAKRLTDAEWIARLDAKQAPPVPEWMAPITAPVRGDAK